ncbi:baseplate J/gp47 family protein [Ruminococcaceae bacterium OttesenSCG-928-N02]|nr:baseplate J/gp47 family protein [Ruminococcaceae bacterium OttesenSCG-928-N02]
MGVDLMAGEYLELYTYPYILQQALNQVPDGVDKREGSIIFDALAPACYELAHYYTNLKQLYADTYVATANGQYLDYRVEEQGIERYGASAALRRGDFTAVGGAAMVVPIGSRFSTASNTTAQVNFVITGEYAADGVAVPGAYILQAETLGTIGNEYVGQLVPVNYINGLAVAEIGAIIQSGQDSETDAELRQRYYSSVGNKPFGGNVAEYDQYVKSIDGVGGLQVYPVWNGGGTVKLVVVDSTYRAISSDFVANLQAEIDPANANGDTGLGNGMAPIGHKVTVTTPTEVPINVEATVAVLTGYTLPQLQDAIETQIGAYLLTLRMEWEVADAYNDYAQTVYLAQVIYAILSVPGVANVTNATLNGTAADLVLQEDATVQELPTMGTVVLNAN